MNKHYDIEWLTKKVAAEEPLEFLYFWGHTQSRNQKVGSFCFSQWFESPFIAEGVTYRTTEHWMMAQKAKLFENKDIFQKIIACQTPKEAKQLGRKVTGFDDTIWRKHRYDIVRQGNIYKFSQNKELGDYLIQSDDKILVEASPVDPIWGIGLAKDSPNINNVNSWKGLNLLGFALMEVRDILVQSQAPKPQG